MIDNAISTIALTCERLESNPHIYVSMDKGNKKVQKNLVEYICWYDIEKKYRVHTFWMLIAQMKINLMLQMLSTTHLNVSFLMMRIKK